MILMYTKTLISSHFHVIVILMKPTSPKQTSWGGVADWYDGMVNDSDSYQKNVLMPNLIRIVDPKIGMTILDLACGQGYFARAFAQNGAKVIGYDISKELIAKAMEASGIKKIERLNEEKIEGLKTPNLISEKKVKPTDSQIEFHVSPADSVPFIADNSVDTVTVILALQNIENMPGVFSEAGRVLKPGGKMIFVINHPAYRIPQKSSWEWVKSKVLGGIEGAEIQFRRIDAYMSDQTIKIDMTPGEKDAKKKKYTVSFHRPLQSYFKAMSKSGLSIVRLEEWISHKKSQSGPRMNEEDRMRKEIPMFICVEAKKG